MSQAPRPIKQGHKLLIDLVPVVAFFVAFKFFGLMIATGVLVVTSLIAMSISYALTRHISLPLAIGTGLVVIFGALTLWLNDELFIKIRPTLVNLLFASVLLIGAYGFRRGFLRYVLDMAFHLTPEGWRVLSIRWGWFFACLAGANELVWRTQPTELWVNYKTFGVLLITMTFAMSQIKAMQRFLVPEENSD